MNYVPNQNEKVLEGFYSDDLDTKLKCLRYFKMTLFYLQVLKKSLPIPLSFPIHSSEYAVLFSYAVSEYSVSK